MSASATSTSGMCCPIRTALVAFLLLLGCQGFSAPEVAETVGRLASSDKILAERAEAPTLAWTTDSSGRIASERSQKKLGKVSSRLGTTADGEWEVALGSVHRVALKPVGARASGLEIEGKRAIYRDAYASTDAIFTSSNEFAEQFLLLRDSRAPTSFSWELRFPGAVRSVRPSDFGALEFMDESEKPVLTMPRPVAVDSAGHRREGSLEWGGRQIVLSIDTKDLIFPVLVDPVIQTMGWVRVPLLGNRSGGPAMATLGSTVVLFGGDTALDERTWIFDGTTWSPKLVSPHPSARSYAAMATLGSKVVLFGGIDPVNYSALDDTWEWDGATWTRRYPATTPPPRDSHAMATLGDKVVLFGGAVFSELLGDTWEWDGSNWTQKTPAASPPPRESHVLGTLDSNVILFGGELAHGDDSSETWLWNGTSWSQAPYSAFPVSHIWGSPLTAAPLGGRLIMHGAFDAQSVGATWEWDGSAWTELAQDGGPDFFSLHALATLGSEIIGIGASGATADEYMPGASTWGWSGTSWTPILGPDSPPGCAAPHLAAFKDQVIEICSDYAQQHGTWAWDGSSWTSIPAGVVPEDVADMAAGTGSLVAVTVSGDSEDVGTWEFDGATWTKASPLLSPFPWWGTVCMASQGGQAFLASGADVWRYDTTTWTVTHPPPGVVPGYCDGMTSFQNQLLLVSGDTYLFDGTSWSDQGTLPATVGGCHMAGLAATALLSCASANQSGWEWSNLGVFSKTCGQQPYWEALKGAMFFASRLSLVSAPAIGAASAG